MKNRILKAIAKLEGLHHDYRQLSKAHYLSLPTQRYLAGKTSAYAEAMAIITQALEEVPDETGD